MHRTVRAALFLQTLLLALASARGEVEMRLLPVADANAPGGLAPARLVLADPNGDLPAVASVAVIRLEGGGPILLFDVTVAPGTKQQAIDVVLPAVSPQQTYRVGLLAGEGGGGVLAQATVSVAWPVELAARARREMIDFRVYEEYQEQLPRWPPALRRTVLVAAVLGAVLLAATLFVGRPARRLAAVLVLAAAMAAGAVWAVGGIETVRRRDYGSLVVLGARRTTTVTLNGAFAPVYRSQTQMDGDDIVLRPGKRLRVTVLPEQVRIFRAAAP